MRALGLLLGIAIGSASAVAAAEGTVASTKAAVAVSPGEVTATPEMWFYEQSMQQYLNPQLAVRRNAEAKYAERQRRMASLKWFGLSNSRPRASSDPMHGDYAPQWSSNNSWFPNQWNGTGPSVAVVPQTDLRR